MYGKSQTSDLFKHDKQNIKNTEHNKQLCLYWLKSTTI